MANLINRLRAVLQFFGLALLSDLRESQKKSALYMQRVLEATKYSERQHRRAERWKRDALENRKTLVDLKYMLEVPSRQRIRGASNALKLLREDASKQRDYPEEG